MTELADLIREPSVGLCNQRMMTRRRVVVDCGEEARHVGHNGTRRCCRHWGKCLNGLADELRRELADVRWFRLHPGANKRRGKKVPSSTEAIQISQWDPVSEKWEPNWDETVEVLDAGEGMSLSRSAERYLEGKGVDALPMRSLAEIGWMCHARHGAHCEADGCLPEGGPIRTPLCERVVVAVVELRQPLGQVAWREDRPADELHGIAVQGLRHAKSWRHRQLHMYMRTARELERDTRVICPVCLGKSVSMRPGRVA